MWFLSLVLLKMYVGHSFRDSLKEANRENDPFSRVKWQKIIDSVVFSQQKVVHKPDFLNILARELKEIDQQSHLSLQNVKNLRRKYEIQEEFRHRSGQALYQNRVQSLVITSLYIFSVVFILNRYGLQSVMNVLILSVSLFLVGFAGVWLMGRRIRWKH